MIEKGLVQIYTGNGKGKTTAAIGLAVRAAGQNNNVLIYQFLKPPTLDLGERKALKSLSDRINIRALDMPWDIYKSFEDTATMGKTQKAVSIALAEIEQFAASKAYDLIILDEIVYCEAKKLAKFKDISKIIKRKHPQVEIVMTGREASEAIIGLADLVTEMKKIKHPYDKGIKSRQGIEF
ncbi:MAG: cob(I)yrinic acid a,c-diamide adenosyltransferase [Planctomycetes bacterium]|nr:cob(I)yrinic acid a,c-diamide adenosyltransferase [Planctomycetota bacterium]MBL7106882.1 cob(I)yrinic acid a,c-diamide adenosyltransferase [Phycisphaerae bacterium]